VFEKRVLRKIFGRKTEGLTGGCRALPHNVYFYRMLLRAIKSLKEDELDGICSSLIREVRKVS
jgi:hypothetical protein